MQRARVGAAVAGVIALAAVLSIPPTPADPGPVAAAPLTPIPAGAERLPIGPPFAAVTSDSVLRAAHSTAPAPASVTPPQVTVAAAPSGPQGIPVPVLDAYRRAAELLARSDAGCHLSWNLLAGIGRIESGHAYGGRVDGGGDTRGKILGPRLDGTLPGTAVITDSDGGAMDGDGAFDRATGPMQFLPGTWKGFGADGNDDGAADPNNIYDAALGAGRYLCAGPGDLREAEDVRKALYRYNPSDAYGRTVMAWAETYRGGTTPVPPRADPVPTPATPPVAPDEPAPDVLAAGSAPDGAPQAAGSDADEATPASAEPAPEVLAAGSAPDGAAPPEPTPQAAESDADQSRTTPSAPSAAAEPTPAALAPAAGPSSSPATTLVESSSAAAPPGAPAPLPSTPVADGAVTAAPAAPSAAAPTPAATPAGTPETPAATSPDSPATVPSTPVADGAASAAPAPPALPSAADPPSPAAPAPAADPSSSATTPTGSPELSAVAPGSPATLPSTPAADGVASAVSAAPSAAAEPTPAAPAPAADPSSSPAAPASSTAVAPDAAALEAGSTAPASPSAVPTPTPAATAPAPPPAAAECPAEPVVLKPAAIRVLPDGAVLLRFAIPAGCTVTGATLTFTPGAADRDRPVEIRRVTGEWNQHTTEAPPTAEPALTAAAPDAGGARSVPVTALVATGGTGLLLGTSGELTGPVQLTLTVG